jgi:pantoate--beta-alanine ligase
VSTPAVARSRARLDGALREVRAGHGRVVLVPTMGALHEGHASLLRRARALAGVDGAVVTSIFVNPMQFAPGEDLERYPRTFDADLETCGREQVDVVFAPTVEEVYPGGEPEVSVDPGPLGSVFEGWTRPTHFRGVLTVVAKLLGLVRPDVAVFGEKDYQQLVLVRRMVADLCLPVEIVGAETCRESDGLALSSRNRYLDHEGRVAALTLSRALRTGVDAAPAGAPAVLRAAQDVLDAQPGLDVDYLVLTAPDLGEVPDQGPARLLVAGRVGSTRLIDNVALELGPGDPPRDGPTDRTTWPHPETRNP